MSRFRTAVCCVAVTASFPPFGRKCTADRLTEVLDEVRVLIDRGFREVVLTGIHLGHYGVDFNQGKPKSDWTRLSHLVRAICNLSADVRVRLSSIEATEVTRELIEVMTEFPNQVCPHLHVCLQSGSDRILRRMKRRWTRRHIIDRCELVKQELRFPAFTTDVIVGFPGETEADFEDTLDACRTNWIFQNPHVSVQPATRNAGGRDDRSDSKTGQIRTRAGS